MSTSYSSINKNDKIVVIGVQTLTLLFMCMSFIWLLSF